MRRTLQRLADLLTSDRNVVVIAVLLHVVVLPIRRPLILPDEAGFLLNAIQLGAGGVPSGLGYYPGYSLLIAPIAAGTVDLASLMVGVQIVNAVLAGVTALLATRLGRAVRPTIPRAAAGLVGLLVSLYPAFRVFGAFALSENLLVPLSLLLCLLLLRAVVSTSRVDTALFALVAGLTYAVHARAVVVPMAAALAIVFLFRRQRQALVGGIGALLIGVVVAFAFVENTLSFSGIVTVDSDSRDTLSGLIRSTLGAKELYELVLTAAGQIFYLVAATAGLVVVGVSVLASQARHGETTGDPSSSPARTLAAFVLPMSLLTLVISAMFLNGQSGDQAIYGRYNEGVLAPLLVYGAVALQGRDHGVDTALRRAVIALPALALILLLGRGPEVFDGRQQILNITGVFPLVDLGGTIRLSTIALAGALLTAAVALAVRRSPSMALGGLGALFLVVVVWDLQIMAGAIETLDGQDELVADIDEVIAETGVACVALDQATLTERWHQENYRLRLAPFPFRHWDSDSDAAPCSDIVLSRRIDLDDRVPGARVVAVEPNGRQLLWALPGPSALLLEQAGRQLYDDPDRPLPENQVIRLEINVEDPFALPGGKVRGSVTVFNDGPFPLYPERALPSSEFSINIGLEWRDPIENLRRQEPERLRLPVLLAPGEQVELPFILRALDQNGRLGPGKHLLRAEVVQEAIAWTGLADATVISVVRELPGDE